MVTKTTSLFGRLFCAFMALYLLNCSVDSPDTQRDTFKDDLAINDQESLLEILIEKVFGYNDAIAEYDDDDSETQPLKKNIPLDHYVFTKPSYTIFNHTEDTRKIPLAVPQRIGTAYFTIISPPPEA